MLQHVASLTTALQQVASVTSTCYNTSPAWPQHCNRDGSKVTRLAVALQRTGQVTSITSTCCYNTQCSVPAILQQVPNLISTCSNKSPHAPIHQPSQSTVTGHHLHMLQQVTSVAAALHRRRKGGGSRGWSPPLIFGSPSSRKCSDKL